MNRRFSAQRLGEHRDGFLCVLQASVLKRLLLGSWPRCAIGKSWKLPMSDKQLSDRVEEAGFITGMDVLIGGGWTAQ